MPELPEVESVKRALAPLIIDKTVVRVEVLRKTSFIGDPARVTDMKIIELTRHGKIMSWKLQDSSESIMYLNIHLKMSGRFALERTVHTRVIFTFTDGSLLYFNDPRTFGWIKVSDQADRYNGLDVYIDKITPEYLHERFQSTTRDIKTVLLDQSILAGIGNIYACDILWEAHISPFTRTDRLTMNQCNDLSEAIQSIIAEAVAHQGSSKTWVYRLPDGSSGGYQERFKVYDRVDEPCRRCGTSIKRIKQSGRSTWWCEYCQIHD